MSHKAERIWIKCDYCRREFERKVNTILPGKKLFCNRFCHYNYTEPIADRFWRKIQKDKKNKCWEWTGTINGTGYGEIVERVNGISSVFRTHRLSWELHFGKIPKGMFVCHKCDNPPCCNPHHLFLGSHQENMQDKVMKGRQRGGGNYGTKLSSKEINEIRRLYEKEKGRWGLQKRLANKFKVSTGTISSLINCKRAYV